MILKLDTLIEGNSKTRKWKDSDQKFTLKNPDPATEYIVIVRSLHSLIMGMNLGL